MTWRRLGVLVTHLPPEAATVRATLGERATWTQDRELLAAIFDRLGLQIWQAQGKASAPKPDPFPRPTSEPRRHRTSLTPKQIAARLLAQQEREAGRRCG